MSKTPWQTVFVFPALFLLLPPGAGAQQAKDPGPRPSDSKKTSKAAKAPDKVPLRSVTLVNTTDAARKVAEEEIARKQMEKESPLAGKQQEPGKGAGSAVLEFHATESTPAADSSRATVQEKGRKKPALKNIHGSAYGGAASGIGRANGEGGAVGADSRGGKLNVYVEGGHTQGTTPGPH